MNIPISFKVSGNELSAYMDTIKQKSAEQANASILSAKEQSTAGKEQLDIITSQISSIERKNRMELMATRSILMQKRQEAIEANEKEWDQRRGNINNDAKAGKVDFETARRDLDETYRNQRYDRSDINSEYQDEVRQSREDERLQKAILESNLEQISEIKRQAQENIKAIKGGDKSLADVFTNSHTEDEKLVARLTQDGLKERKEKEKNGGIFGSLLAMDNLNKGIQLLGTATQTQSGFDLIAPASNLLGKIVFGAIGAGLGALTGTPFGVAGGISAGIAVGSIIGDSLGEVEQRQAFLKQDFFKSSNKFYGTTGVKADDDIAYTNNSGVDVLAFLNMRREFAMRRGYEGNSIKTTKDAIYGERGLGVEQGTSNGIIEIQRSAKEENRDLAALLTGIFEKSQQNGILKGKDTTFFNEFLNRFTNLQKELLKSQNTVATGTTFDILKTFNSFGGMLDARDPRSSGIISGINSSLQNPASDNMKAMEFGILRDKMPKGTGLFAFKEEISKGIGSKFLLSGLMEQIDKMGGGSDAAMLNLSGAFPSVAPAAIRTIYENRKKLKNWDTSELKGVGLNDEVLKAKADGNTTDIERNSANLNNGILAGKEIAAMSDALVKAIENAFNGPVIVINEAKGTVTLKTQQQFQQATIQQNVAKTAKDRVTQKQLDNAMDGIRGSSGGGYNPNRF